MVYEKTFVVIYLIVAVWVTSQIQAKNIITSPNIIISDVSSTQAAAFWSAVVGEEVTGYILCLLQGSNTTCIEVSADRLNFTFYNLLPAKNYSIQISAINVSNESIIQEGPSSVVTFNTAATTTPSVPETPFVNITNRVEPKTPSNYSTVFQILPIGSTFHVCKGVSVEVFAIYDAVDFNQDTVITRWNASGGTVIKDRLLGFGRINGVLYDIFSINVAGTEGYIYMNEYIQRLQLNNLDVKELDISFEVTWKNLTDHASSRVKIADCATSERAKPVISEPSQNIPIIIRTISELENYSLEQVCKSSGIPEPEIKWTSNTNITSDSDLILQPGDLSIEGDVNPYIFTCTASNSEGEDTRNIRIRIDIDLTDEIEKLENVTVEIVRTFSKIITKNIQGVDVTYEEPFVSREVIDRNADNLVNLVIKYNESDIGGEDKKEAIEGILQPVGDIIQKDSELNYEDDETVVIETKVEEGDVATASKGLTKTLDSLEILGSNLIIDIPTNITTSVYISSPIVTLVAENYLLDAGNDYSKITVPDSSTIEDKGIEERIQIPVQVARLLSSNNNTNFRISTSIVKNTLKQKQKYSEKNTTDLVSNIISVVIPGYENKVQAISLPEPVLCIFPVTSINVPNKQQTCSFLKSSLWSTNGLTTEATEENLTYCYTDHFTSFAVFVSPRKLPNDEFSQIASLVSYVLVSISFVALVVSLVLFLISGKYFFKVEANIVYFNYCLAMTLAFGLFLFGIESGKFHIIACMTIAFLLHYIWLAVFVWTLCNGILIMYKLTIGILREHKIYPYLICFGWISPIIIPIITIAIKHKNYVKPEEHCFITYEDGLIWSFIGPILIILTINMIILVFASIRIATAKFGTDKLDEKQALRKGIISSLILTPLLGIPWLILLVNVFIPEPVVQWAFIIINGLMGVFFFFAVTLRNAEVKKLCTKSSKTVQQPSTSLTGGKTSGMLSKKFKRSISKDEEQVSHSKGDTNKKGEYIQLDVYSPTSPTDEGVVRNETTSKPKLLPKPKYLLKPKKYPKDLPDTREYPCDIPEDIKPIDPSNIYDFLKPKTESDVYIELDVENDIPEFGIKPQFESTKVNDKKLYQNLDSSLEDK